MSDFLWYCQKCGNVGFHSEACIAATSAEKIAEVQRYALPAAQAPAIEVERLARALRAIGYPKRLLMDPYEWAAAIAAAYEREAGK